MSSIQAIVNKLAGTSGLSVQEALCEYYGYTGLPYSVQDIFSINSGVSPTNKLTVQQMLYDNVKTSLGLTGIATEYSEQDLWNKAYSTGLALNQITGNLQGYIKSLSGLVAYYPLDETSGNAINKAPATLGTLDGTVTGATQGVAGQIGKAYSFDGLNDEVNLSNAASFQLTAGTLGIIIKPASDIGTLTKATLSKENAFALFVDNKIFKTYSWGGSAGFRSTDVDVVTDQLYHYISMSFDNGVVNGTTLYVDGVLKLTTTLTIQSNAQVLDIGRSSISSHWFKGVLQHAFITNSLMTEPQHLKIAQLAGLA